MSGLNSTRGRASTGIARLLSTTFSDSSRAMALLTFSAVDATLDSVRHSFDVFVARSERIRAYRQKFGHLLAEQVQFVEGPARAEESHGAH